MKLRFIFVIYCLSFVLVNGFAQSASLSQSWADSTLSKMSMDERIGQLFMIYAYSNTTEENNLDRLAEIKKYHVGGVLFMQGNPEAQVALTNRFQAESTIPLFIAIDGEWGLSMRLKNTVKYPRQMALGAIRNEYMIYRFGLQVGREMSRMGIHINFAPDVDVNTNPLNPVINTRSFGEDPEEVARKGVFYMKGLQEAGVMAVAKHFPGHGNTASDSHKELPRVDHSLSQIKEYDLYPFQKLIDEGVEGVIVGHLWVPALDTMERASSLSHKIISDILRDSMHFKGLIFTDGMGMAGVKVNDDSVYKDAILAGNDILLFPPKIKDAFEEVKAAVANGSISEEIINDRCRNILINKYKHGLSVHSFVRPEGIASFVNSPEANALNEQLVQESITVLKNKKNILPFSDSLLLRKQTIVQLGGTAKDVFEQTCSFYRDATFLRYSTKPSVANIAEILKTSVEDSVVIIALNSTSFKPTDAVTDEALNLIKQVTAKKKVILCMLTNPYSISRLKDITAQLDALVLGYDFTDLTQKAVAQVLYGGAAASGIIPVTALDEYARGTGETTRKTRLGFTNPEKQGMDSHELQRIDSVVNLAINAGAIPGCQIIVARNGEVVLDKSYGYYTYNKKQRVDDSDLYDLASVTKISATLPAIMHLVENNKLKLSDTLGELFDEFKDTDKSNITIEDLLHHESGFPAFIPMANLFMDSSKLEGSPLFSRYKNATYTIEVDKGFYGNKNRSFESNLFSPIAAKGYSLPVAKGLFAKPVVKDSIWQAIVNVHLGVKKYVYSDLNFLILQKVIEKLSGVNLDQYINHEVYATLNGGRSTYRPLNEFPAQRIVPTEQDNFFRKQLLQGYVHDMNAALMGGIAGHAGFFSSARDLAKMMQMYLNGGTYGGTNYFKSETITKFAQTRSIDNRRGLGFDKPELNRKKINPVAASCSPNSFGHSGFTGTLAWVDPDYNLVYIFLSNRVYPQAYNRKLVTMGTRTEIQKIIYEAIAKGASIESYSGSYEFASNLTGINKLEIGTLPTLKLQKIPEQRILLVDSRGRKKRNKI